MPHPPGWKYKVVLDGQEMDLFWTFWEFSVPFPAHLHPCGQQLGGIVNRGKYYRPAE